MESSFFGMVTMTSLENVHQSKGKSNEKVISDDLMDETRIRLVHYPDCQQLIIWLPVDGDFYQDLVICDSKSKHEIWRKEIREIITGTIKIVLDTLPFKPGEFYVKINKKDGLQHIIYLKKYKKGVIPKQPITVPEIEPDLDKAPIVYRDGFGNILPDEDLILRQNIIDKMIDKFSRHLEYVSQGRGGDVIYLEGKKSIKFYMEMGGGNCVFYLDIPSISEWEKTTGFPLSEREDIIHFVAEQTQRDQASSCTYKISDTEITYFRR